MRHRKTLTILLVGFIFGIAGTAYFKNKSSPSRGLASLPGKGKLSFAPAPMGKHLQLVKVDILDPEFIPEKKEDTVELKGRILVNQSIQGDLKYSWRLPVGVELISGELDKKISGIEAGQIIEVSLKVKGFSKEKQSLISLQASTQRGDMVLGGSFVLPSRPEDTWEAIAPDLKQSADEQLGPSPEQSASE